MEIKLAPCRFFLHLLMILGGCVCKGKELTTTKFNYENNHNKEDTTHLLQLHSMDIHKDNDNSIEDSSSHMNHMDASLIVFFLIDDLKQGKTMRIFFPKRTSSPQFLPKQEADNIPFSLEGLQNLLELFSFPHGSSQAKAIEDTLRQCETEPIKGEIKLCPTSFESMIDFVHEMLGTETSIKPLSTTHFTESPGGLKMYTILKSPEEILAQKMVACHTMPYPYAVFYCHYQVSQSKIFKVSLSSEHGDLVEAVVVCHMDTSQWSPNHASFRVLGIEPGSSPVCHFFPDDNLVWIPTPPVSTM